MTEIRLAQTSAGCPEQYDALDEHGNIVGFLHLRHGWFRATADGTEVYGTEVGDRHCGVFDVDERQRYLDTAVRKIREHLDGRTPEDTAQDIAEALERAAISDWDASDGKVIEIYVSQIAPIVARILKGENQ